MKHNYRPTVTIDGEKLAGETNPQYRKLNERLNRKNAKANPADAAFVVQTFLAAITGKAYFAGETLEDLVKRVCPEIYGLARERGLVFNLDIREPETGLPMNTHAALKSARIFYECVPVARH